MTAAELAVLLILAAIGWAVIRLTISEGRDR